VKFSARQDLIHYLRLSFAFYDEAHLVEGVGRLRQALAAFVD
jgi:DNA-binding transcriptional MocR family regulator